MKRKKKIKLVPIIAFIVAAGLLLFTAFYFGLRELYPIKYREEILYTAQKYDIEPELLFALVHTESRFNAEAVSYVGASGLTQITSDTFDWIKWRMDDASDISYDDITDPEIALDYGGFLLRAHLDEFYTIENALCAYNAGRGTLIGWLSDNEYSEDINGVRTVHTIPYKETANYVKKIEDAQKIYEMLYEL